jgi:hypothetical protein
MKLMKKLLILLLFLVGNNAFAQSVLWAKSISGINDEVGISMTHDEDCNVYVTGWFSGTVDFDPSPNTFNLVSSGNNDIFISKYSSNGALIWAKRIGGSNDDTSSSIKLDQNNNIILTGRFSSNVDFNPSNQDYILYSSGSYDIFVSKFTSDGDFIFAKKMGGSSDDQSESVCIDSQGNIFVTGRFADVADFDSLTNSNNLISNGSWDIFVCKLDGNGNTIWAKRMGGMGDDRAYSMAIDSLDNLYFTGTFNGTCDFNPTSENYLLSSSGYRDAFIVKWNNNGDFHWAKKIGSVGNDWGESIISNGNEIFLTGVFENTVNVGSDYLISNGSSDALICKLSNDGDFIWSRQIGGNSSDYGNSIDLDEFGNIYVTGTFSNLVNFNQGATTNVFLNATLSNAFVCSFEDDSDFLWAKHMGGSNNDYGDFVLLDCQNEVLTLGRYRNTSYFDVEEHTHTLVSVGSTDIFFQKIVKHLLSNDEIFHSELILYPNPSDNLVYFNNIKQYDKLLIFDNLGKLVYDKNIANGDNMIDVSDLKNGTYFFIFKNSTSENIMNVSFLKHNIYE